MCDYVFSNGIQCDLDTTLETPHFKFEGKRYCIFHYPNRTKDKNEFIRWFREFRAQRTNASSIVRLEGFIFPDVGKELNSIKAHKGSNWVFDQCEFLAACDFTGSIFYSVSFLRSIFNGPTQFNEVDFKSNVNFQHAEFKGETSFFRALFNTEAESSTSFVGSTFREHVSFCETIFNGHVSFLQAIFFISAWFKSTLFKGDVFFTEIFLQYIDFRFSLFYKNNIISVLPACNTVYFANYNGEDKVYFLCKEDIEYYYNDKTNEIVTDKNSVSLIIYNSVFSNYLLISEKFKSIFIDKSKLQNTSIGKQAGDNKPFLFFQNVDFSDEVYIKKVILLGITVCIISKPIIIQDSDLKQASFIGTSLINAVFENCDWPLIKRGVLSMSKLSYLFDENILIDLYIDEKHIKHLKMKLVDHIFPRIKNKYYNKKLQDKIDRDVARFAESYREIALTYEIKHHFGLASEFKIGEYEMRRINSKTHNIEKILLWIYKYLGSYGESIWKPIISILSMIMINAIIYLYTGFDPAYDRVPSWRPDLFGECLEAYWKAIVFSFRSCFPFRSYSGENFGDFTWIIMGFQWVFFTIFTTLLVFAIRRKTHR